MRVSRLRCTLFALLAGSLFAPRAIAQAGSVPAGQIPAGPKSAGPATPQTPFDRVIGAHLAEWAKQASAGGKRATPALSRDAVDVRVVPPSFVAAPFLTLYTPNPNDLTSKLANPVAADFNNDGKIDYVNVELNGTINTLLNPGSYANFASLKPLPQNTSAVGSSVGIAQVVVADMNGDGNADLVAVDINNSNIVVWLGKGDGTFADAAYYPVAPRSGATWAQTSGSLVVADFNGDGRPDVATIETSAYNPQGSTTTITELTFLNQGDGTLVPFQEANTTVNEVVTASIGGADLISADGLTPSGIAFAITDTAAGSPGTSIYVISSKGDGSFTAPVAPSAPLFSNGGNSMLITTNLTAGFPTARGVGSLSRNKLRSSNSFLGAGIPLTDVVVVGGDGAIYNVSCAAGASNPALATVLAGQPQNLGGGTVFPTSPTGFPLTANTGLVIADFNGDGYQDLLTTTPANAYIFLNTGNRSFNGAPAQVTGGSPGNIVAADFDNSGFSSFVWADYALAQLGYYQNLGAESTSLAGTFFAAPTVAGPSTNGGTNYFSVGGSIRVQATADVNGDGLQDVIAMDQSYVYRDGFNVHHGADIVVGINNGVGLGANEATGFTFKTLISGIDLAPLGVAPFLEPVAIKSSAGTTIVIATESPAALYTVTYDGVSKVSAPQALNLGGLAPICNFYYADAGDVNGDGIADLVAAYPGDALCNGSFTPGSGAVNSGFFTFLGNGDGTFQPGQFTTVGNELYKVKLINFSGTASDVVAVDSFTPPFFLRQPSIYHTYLVPGNGDGTFQAANAVDVAPNYIVSDVVAGDFNMDGKQDLTLTTEGQYDTGSGSVLPNTMGALLMTGNGDRTFGQAQLVDQGIFPASGVFADFNGDGTLDLALSQFIGTNVQAAVPILEVFPNLGSGVFGPSFGEFIQPFAFQQEGSEREFGSPLFAGAFSRSGNVDLLISNGSDTSMFVNEGAPALQVSAGSASAMQNAPVTLTASLVQGGNVVSTATGAVTFSIHGTQLGSSSLSNGTATFVTTALPVGTDVVSVAYSGDAGDNAASGSVSVAITALPPVTPVAPQLTMTASASTLSLSAGATGSVVLNVAANQTFSGTVNFACAGLPAEASCSINPTSVALAAMQTNNVAVVIATTPKNNTYHASNRRASWDAVGGLSLAGLILFAVPRRRRLPGVMGMIAIGLLSLGSVAALVGCGGSGGDQYPGTPAGTYNVTVTATSGATTLTQIITLTIN